MWTAPLSTRNPYATSDYDPAERWEEKANCKGMAFTLFEYAEKDSPACKDMDYMTRMAFNRTNFELAAEICIECPVMFKCIESATTDERAWTVRGGLIPTRFINEAHRYDNQGRPAKAGQDRICSRGHHVKGGGRCKDCKRIRDVAAQRDRRASTYTPKGVS